MEGGEGSRNRKLNDALDRRTLKGALQDANVEIEEFLAEVK